MTKFFWIPVFYHFFVKISEECIIMQQNRCNLVEYRKDDNIFHWLYLILYEFKSISSESLLVPILQTATIMYSPVCRQISQNNKWWVTFYFNCPMTFFKVHLQGEQRTGSRTSWASMVKTHVRDRQNLMTLWNTEKFILQTRQILEFMCTNEIACYTALLKL